MPLPHPRIALAFLLGLAFFWPAPGTAQEPPLRTLVIRHIAAKIRVDGKLDEPVWKQIEPQSGFVQTDPDEGRPVSEKTEVRIFYDDNNLYFGFTCYESEPKKIVARFDMHDARTNSDSVDIFLDPFGDRRTGYWFSINARGVQFDALRSESAGTDSTWDGIWESAAHIADWGWSAEVAIPFKSIRFVPGRDWGINLSRDIVRKNERANWQFVARFDAIFRPSKAGILRGVEDVRPGRNIELIPYFSSSVRRGATIGSEDGENYQGGLDLRWGVLPNATLNLTVNPDFADTEADEINISLSRFELFFPEKRKFFNEASNFYTTPLDLFFTRRVGERLPDGQPQRILFGGKLTGKIGKWSLGVLESLTKKQDFTDPADGLRKSAPNANFFVLRVQRDIFRSSTIGFATVNRDQEAGVVGSTQRAHAVDLGIVKGQHFVSFTQFVFNQNKSNTERGWDRVGGRTGFTYSSDTWEYHADYKYLGHGFDVSAIGFEPETDRHKSSAYVTYKPFVNRYGVRQFFFELNQDISLDTSGLLQDSGSDALISASFQNFWFAQFHYAYDRVRFNRFSTTPNCPPPYACAPAFAALPSTRVYIEPAIRVEFNTNENRPVYLNYEFTQHKFVQFHENFYGREQSHEAGITARFLGHTRVQFSGLWNREFLLDHTPFQNRRLFIARVNHQFSRKLRMRFLGQISNDRLGQDFRMNSIVAYDFTARSAAIVGYNFQRRSPTQPGDLGNEFFAKLSYLVHF